MGGQLVGEKYHPFFPDAPHAGAHDQFLAIVDKHPEVLQLALAHVVVQELIRSNKNFDKDGLPKWHASIGALKDGVEPGNYGFDPLNLAGKTDAAKAQRRNQEVNNGRLAMLACLGSR